MRERDPRLELRRGRTDRLPYFDVRGYPRLSSHQFINAGGWLLAIPPNTDRRDFEKEIAEILADADRAARKASRASTAKTASSPDAVEGEDHVEQSD